MLKRLRNSIWRWCEVVWDGGGGGIEGGTKLIGACARDDVSVSRVCFWIKRDWGVCGIIDRRERGWQGVVIIYILRNRPADLLQIVDALLVKSSQAFLCRRASQNQSGDDGSQNRDRGERETGSMNSRGCVGHIIRRGVDPTSSIQRYQR